MRRRKWLSDLGALVILLLLPLILFWPQVLGSRTLLPADNLYQWQPYHAYADQLGVPQPPHNELLSDLVLENLVWKRFIVQSLRAGALPLWNPHLFAGVPFLAAGQHSALYPLSLVFYVLPLSRAYGLFTVLQLWLAGVCMYLFVRVLRLRPFPALIAGITYELSAFFVVSVVFPMIIAAAAWLPLLLAAVERMVRKQEEKGSGPFVPIVYVAMGAVALGMVALAGHPEILVYTLLVVAYYAVGRLLLLWRRVRAWSPVLRLAVWMVAMVGLGLGLGSLQLIPLLELVTRSFREGSVTYRDVVGWAYPVRQIATFVIPDFFGDPSAHGYWDLVARQWVGAGRIFWGVKNYVESGSYVGILPLVLAAVGVFGAGRRSKERRIVWVFALLALVSLLFVFGTPLYAVLYYALPGVKQLHSPFRWVFPYTLSVAVLAAFGAAYLTGRETQNAGDQAARGHAGRLRAAVAWGILGVGLVLTGVLIGAYVAPARFVPLADRFLAAVPEARQAFGTGQAFLSYEWPKFLILALMLSASGLVLLLLGHSRDGLPPHAAAPPFRRLNWGGVGRWLALAVVATDLLLFGWGFAPSADPKWLDFRPKAVEWLQQHVSQDEPWRMTTYQIPADTKTMNANIPWLVGLEDVRGYDSIIPRQYVELMRAIEPQGELAFNRIAPIYDAANLSSPLLDLLTVRYVVTEGEIPNADYTLVYSGEVRIYENTDVLPRAFALPAAEAVGEAELPDRLRSFDPRQVVLLDPADLAEHPSASAASGSGWPLQPAAIASYTPNEVTLEVALPGPGWLVLGDSYFPGWKAYRSAVTSQSGPGEETELKIVRADGNFRAVWLEAGTYQVRFKYTPLSAKLGLYGSFMAVVILGLLLLYWLWGRFYRESAGDHAVKRVAKNSLVNMGLQLLNRLLDFAFAMLMLRILAPQMAGRLQFSIAFIGYFDILVRWGLGTYITREIAKDRAQGSSQLSMSTVLRGFLWLGSLPLMALVLWVYALGGQMTSDIVLAVGLFAISMIFSTLADGFSAVFNAYEKMEYPAAIATVTAVTRVTLGVLALLAGWGFVGLAGVSIVANVVSAAILGMLMVRHCFRPRFDWNGRQARSMLAASFPLMINVFLATAFFRIDVLLLKPMQGDAAVGYYSAAYKYIDGLNIIPAYFTLALFPLMSRYAAQARDSLMRAYVLSLRLLLLIAVPVAVGTVFVSRGLILLLGGPQYLPQSQIALQLLIWFLPFSFINSVTQYVLIAIDQQHFLTRAFLIGVTFNIIANLVAIRLFSYKGAAVVTVVSELVLLAPFYYSVRKNLGRLPWVSLFWQPVVASAVMAVALWLMRSLPWPLLIPIGGAVYLAALILLGGLRQPDMDLVLKQLVPVGRLRARLLRNKTHAP